MSPDEPDEIQDMEADPSPAPKDAPVEADKSAQPDPASSSAATDAPEADALSVVRDVVDQRPKDPPAEAASSAEGEEAGDGTGEKPPKEQDDENYSDVPFNKHPRFQQLLNRERAARADAIEWRKVTSYLEDNGLSPKEAAEGIEVMALMKLDPVRAWGLLKPRVQNLLIAAGEILPEDLVKRVEAKDLTREGALEISRARAAQKNLEVRQQFLDQRGERRQQTEAGQQLVAAAAEWESNRRIRDPNFEAKLPRIQEKLAFLHNVKKERPSDAAGVKAQLKRVYDEVSKEFSPPPAAQPQTQRRPAVAPVRGGQVAANVRAEGPKSTLDIIRANRQRA